MSNRVLVFTYKDGLLARLAHDLQIECRQFTIDRRGAEIAATFVLGSLRVDGAVERGKLATGVLGDSDRKKIEHTMRTEVLDSTRFADATFTGTVRETGRDFVIDGSLGLHGRTLALAPIAVQRRGTVQRGGIQWIAEVALVPSRWGITPYRALAGALKLQDRVTVRIELDADRGEDGDAQWTLG